MMKVSKLRVGPVVLLAASVGCLHPQTTAQPDSILCWTTGGFGAQRRLVMDLRLKSGNENRVPSSEDVAAVTAVGGNVLYRFHVEVLRVVVDSGAVRALFAERRGFGDIANT